MPNLKSRRPRRLTPEERKSLTHGDFWIPDVERDVYRRALEALNAPQVRLELTGPASPGIFRPAGGDTNGYLHVIMPMHVAR